MIVAYNFIDGAQLSKNAHAKIESWEIWDTFILVGPPYSLSIQDFQEVSEIGYSQRFIEGLIICSQFPL